MSLWRCPNARWNTPYVIEAHVTGKPFHFNGNIRNNGMISNLPPDCCAEGPMYADATGLHRTVVGALPPQCAALNLTNINVQRLAVEAALHGDPEAVVHACALDPLTAASRLSLAGIRNMAADMLEAERQYLPQFSGKTIRRTPAIHSAYRPTWYLPRSPIDPALATQRAVWGAGSDILHSSDGRQSIAS